MLLGSGSSISRAPRRAATAATPDVLRNHSPASGSERRELGSGPERANLRPTYLPSPYRFNVTHIVDVDTQHKKSRSGAHPNRIKRIRMIPKAQEVYFEPHISTVHKYEDNATNSGQQYGTHKAGCPWHLCHIAARCSSCHLQVCA